MLGEFGLNRGLTHSECFLPMLEALLKNAKLKIGDMDAIAVTTGPGSFTGLRIGIATAKAFAHSLDLPLVGVDTLEAQARAAGIEGLVCPILDARRNEVYASLFRGRERLWPDQAVSPEKLAEELLIFPEKITFTGDGLASYAGIIQKRIGDRFEAAPAERRLFMATAAAVIGREKFLSGQSVKADELLPYYLRASEAEVRYKAREEEDNN